MSFQGAEKMIEELAQAYHELETLVLLRAEELTNREDLLILKYILQLQDKIKFLIQQLNDANLFLFTI